MAAYPNAMLRTAALTPAEFGWIQDFLYRRSGIELKNGKEALVVGRLERRLRHHGLTTFTEYFRLLSGADEDEARIATDLLTTNETYFFRESQHLDLLPTLLPPRGSAGPGGVRIWSAASSTGEEAYSIALILAQTLGESQWEIVGTDISTRVLETARRALYPLDAAQKIPQPLLKSYCLKGRDEYDGYFTVNAGLRRRVSFKHVNLTEELPDLGTFDVVFLRNVMIYFGEDTKRALVERILRITRPGGYLLIGHAESIAGLNTAWRPVAPSVYQAPGTTT